MQRLGFPGGSGNQGSKFWQDYLAFFWLALRTLTFSFFYMNYIKEAKSLTFRRGSEVSQVYKLYKPWCPRCNRQVSEPQPQVPPACLASRVVVP